MIAYSASRITSAVYAVRKGHLRIEVERAGVRAAVRGGLLVHQACKCYGEDLVSGIYVRARCREREQRARDALPGHDVKLCMHRPVGNVAPRRRWGRSLCTTPAQNGLRGCRRHTGLFMEKSNVEIADRAVCPWLLDP